MTNQEYLAERIQKLSAEEVYDLLYDIVINQGSRYNSSRAGIAHWLTEESKEAASGCEYWDSESNFCSLHRPSAERHGRWEYVKKRLARGGYVDASECSVCHKIIMPHLKPNYCPNCGALMVNEDD